MLRYAEALSLRRVPQISDQQVLVDVIQSGLEFGNANNLPCTTYHKKLAISFFCYRRDENDGENQRALRRIEIPLVYNNCRQKWQRSNQAAV
jgi:hypothetical protein